MTSLERRSKERRVRVALKTAADEATNALTRFLEMTTDFVQECDEAVEDMDYVERCIEKIQLPNTYFYPSDDGKSGNHVKRDLTDLMCELQEAYVEEAMEEHGEDDNFYSTSDAVKFIKAKNEKAREKQAMLVKP